jgi:hypothetical protein
VTAPGSAELVVARLPWMLTAAASLAPDLARVSAASPAEAEANRGEGFPGKLAAGEFGEPGSGPPGQQPVIVAHRGEGTDHPLAVARDPVTEHVAGEDDVTQGGVPAGLSAGMVVEACAAVD